MPTVIITGANRGLGLGLTSTYLDDGWSVIAVNRSDSDELEALGTNPNLTIHRCDLTNDAALQELASGYTGQAIDVLINNAGMMAREPKPEGHWGVQGFGSFDRAMWHRLFDINLFTPMALSELFVDCIVAAPNGRIVTISSMLGSMSMNTSGGLYAYRTSKAAVNMMMKSMGQDLAEKGITSVALHPGWVRTDMGGSGADIDIETSVTGMKAVIDGLTPDDAGKFLTYEGSEMAW